MLACIPNLVSAPQHVIALQLQGVSKQLCQVVNVSHLSAAAYGAKFYATEMAFASDSVTITSARLGLNTTAAYLRTWHETVLYASSTTAPTSSELSYVPSTLAPAYRASPDVETVGSVTPCRCSAPQMPYSMSDPETE